MALEKTTALNIHEELGLLSLKENSNQIEVYDQWFHFRALCNDDESQVLIDDMKEFIKAYEKNKQ